jgi:acyl carrier protein
MSTIVLHSTEQIHELVRATLAELFAIDPARVSLETGLFDELKIDSIDAVDLLLRVERTIGQKISAENFHSVRTVGDLVHAIARLQQV